MALRRISRALLLAALAAGLSACGAGHLLPATGRVVDVSERDFSINVSTQHLAPGRVTFRVTNHGPDDHELIVIRERGTQLPLRTDGITVNEEQLTPETVGALEPGAPGAVRNLTVRLKKGRYVLLCNMSGHFMGGMHAVVVVS